MLHRRAVFALPVLALASCVGTPATPSITGSNAVALWGIAKGVGQVVLGVAETADPALGTVVAGIQAIIAAGEPLVAQAASNASAASALEGQAKALLLAAAPHVSVVSNKA